jgi:phosphoribosylformylglycinamidine synthase
MRATVIVTLKPTVLDPQGMTIQRSVESMGLAGVTDIRQGKYFDITVNDGAARETVEKLAKEVLTNPVIEQYRIVWESFGEIRGQ